MITDTEFVVIQGFDRNLAKAADDAQIIINRKNTELVTASRIIAKLQADIAASEARYVGLQQQITYAALS